MKFKIVCKNWRTTKSIGESSVFDLRSECKIHLCTLKSFLDMFVSLLGLEVRIAVRPHEDVEIYQEISSLTLVSRHKRFRSVRSSEDESEGYETMTATSSVAVSEVTHRKITLDDFEKVGKEDAKYCPPNPKLAMSKVHNITEIIHYFFFFISGSTY